MARSDCALHRLRVSELRVIIRVLMGCYPNYILLISHFDPKNTLILSNDTDFRPKQLTPKFLNIQVFSDNKNLLHKELLRSSSP